MSRQDDPPPDFSVNPQTPTRNVRHKSSLEHVFHFTLASPQPSREQATEADFLYHEILNDCESAGLFLPTPTTDKGVAKVYLHDLFRALHKFCPTDPGRVNLVRMILHGLFSPTSITLEDRLLDTILSLARKWSDATDFERQKTYRTLELIAADFLAGFFIPLTAQSNCTPSVSKVLTPPSASSVGPAQGTPFRLGGLRQLCLLRDGNRCLVSGHLDKQFYQQSRSRGQQPRGIYTVVTQAAHIIPHSLNSVKSIGDSLSTTKSFVWQILNMFQTGTSTELEGSLIDTPANALMLASEIHDEFGKLRCYFEEVEDTPHTYVFRTTRDAAPLLPGFYPLNGRITFVNHEPEGQPLSDLPCRRLLKLHAACCKMMEMAGAAEYVDRVLDDLDRMEKEGTLAASGSSDIGMLLRMKGLGGWAGEYDESVDTRNTLAAGGINVG